MPSRTLLIAAAVLLLSTAAPAQMLDSRGYRLVDPPQRTLTPGKIEVIEFFSYGSPACGQMSPLLDAWASKLPSDVAFRRVATGFGHKAWTDLAKTYYALNATGDLARLHGPLFHAIHREHLPLFDQQSITDWVAKHGVDPQKFATAFASFGVNTELNEAEQMVQAYKITSLPAIAIEGRYVVSGQTIQNMLTHANALIVKLTADRASARLSGS